MRSASHLPTLLGLGLLAIWLTGCSGAPSPTPTPTVQRRAAIASPRAAASPVILNGAASQPAIASPQPEVAAPSLRLPSDGLQVVMVDATEGQGIWTRRQPAGEPIRVWPDGAPMLVVGEDQFADGRTWRKVQTLDGETGWAAAEYLFPTDPTALAAAASSLSELPGSRRTDASASTAVQARVATVQGTPPASLAAPAPQAGPPPSAPPPPALAAPGTAARVASRPSQASKPNAAPPAAKPAAASAAAKPAPTATPVPSATPIRAPSGATSITVGQNTMAVVGSQRGLPIQIGNRPRAGMELLAVQVKVTNRDPAPFLLYRSSFKLALSDRTRVEPLAGGELPLPYSATVASGGELEGSLTFEVPIGTRVDDLIWSPERDVAYSLGI